MELNITKVKIFVTVPSENINDVRNAMCEAGAGVIGNYTYCSTSTKSIGTFMPNADANPFIGEKNKLEFVNEEKLEMICDVKIVKKVINKIKEVHPYEEPDINIVPLLDIDQFN